MNGRAWLLLALLQAALIGVYLLVEGGRGEAARFDWEALDEAAPPLAVVRDGAPAPAPEGPHLVHFWATWCGPCRAIAPHLDALADELDGKLKIVKLDVDKNQNIAVQYGVTNIPTLLLFKDGKLADRMVGGATRGKIADFVKTVL